MVAFAAFILNDFLTLRDHQVRKFDVLISVMTDNIRETLAAGDKNTANDILSSLKAEKHVVSAFIARPNGSIFARYPQNVEPASEIPIRRFKKKGDNFFDGGHLHLYRPIYRGSRLEGVVYLKSDTQELAAIMTRYLLIGAAIILLSSFVAFLLSMVFQRSITRPILHLTRLAQQISEKGEYSLRAPKGSADELGILVDSINRMLSEIEARQIAYKALAQELERKVEERTHELSDANQKLQKEMTERLSAEKEMLEISSKEQIRIGQDLHDGVSQILTGISYMLKTLEKKLSIGAVQAGQAELAEIAHLVRRAITEIKSLSRSLHPVELEQNGFVAAIRELASNSERFFHIECPSECDESIALTDSATATHLYRIAQEAVHNAVKHGKAKRVEIKLMSSGGHAVLLIKDNGVGMPEQTEKFHGMGLRNMRYRAQIINATLDIERDRSGGTIVLCTLPLAKLENPEKPVSPPQREEEQPARASRKGKTRIMIVDDHPIVRQGIAQLIDQEKDLEVCGEADDAATAVKLVKTARPDAILVDVSLKESNGIDLVRYLRDTHPQLPALMVSMHDETVYAEQALKAGALGYVVKQEASENVIKAIRKILKGERYVSGKLGPSIIRKLEHA